MMEKGYRAKDISRLFGLNEGQIKSWHRSGLVPHVSMENEEPVFGFKELVCFKVIKNLMDKGITPRRMRNYLSQLKRILPESERPLTELKFTIEGGELLVCKEGQIFDHRGQIHMDFSVKKPRAVISINRWRHGILQALVSAEKNDPEMAILEYRRLLELDPGDTDAMVNLANIYYGIGNTEKARHWYLEALMLDPDHVEGNYNFANLLDEHGEVQTAIVFYLQSIRNEENFADAHFNVAVCFHKLGKFEEAKIYLKSYLRFDSTSEWAKIALELLSSY
ncbi:MAG: tetratricopeptide repeat protein [Syntrophobacterales bacterium]|nr:MAG: tetratricopeptide repeat protein [Syntrophobacterales bacterium]